MLDPSELEYRSCELMTGNGYLGSFPEQKGLLTDDHSLQAVGMIFTNQCPVYFVLLVIFITVINK